MPALRSLLSWLLLMISSCAAAPAFAAAQIAQAAQNQVGVTLHYDPTYVRLGYPDGDVPSDRGVCSDVVIRALRAVGADLQRLVHEDMTANFSAYPRRWGLSKPDANIDHRRVPNLELFFERKGKALALSSRPTDYRPGDIVSWRLPNGLPHIGVISKRHVGNLSKRPLVVHNIGGGAQVEDVLFAWPQTGHYRWFR